MVTFDNIMHTARAYYFTQIVERVELCGNLTERNGDLGDRVGKRAERKRA